MRKNLAQLIRAFSRAVASSRMATPRLFYGSLLLVLLVFLVTVTSYRSEAIRQQLDRIADPLRLVNDEEYTRLSQLVRLRQKRLALRLKVRECEIASQMEAAREGSESILGHGPSREIWELRLKELTERLENLERLEKRLQQGEPRLREDIRTIWDNLPEGALAFKPKSRMRQGRPEYVIARLSDGLDSDLLEGLEEGYHVESIKISSTMEAHLIGASDEFLIEPLNTIDQALLGGAKEWRWRVVALMPGQRRLFLRIVAQIRPPDDEVVRTDLLVKEAKIEVEVDRWWSAKTFVATNWQWLLGSPVVLAGFCGWLLARWRRKARPAGFSP